MPRGRAGGSFANSGRMTGGSGGGFHYNFGIAIAARAVRDMGLFSNSALGLTAAIYALGRVSSEFVDTVKQNTLAFGGQLKTLNAMVFAQKQLLSGATEFGQQDIMSGMRQLQSVGLNARKEFKFVSDSAEATGQSFSSMSGVINQAIQGNMQGMVQMGLMTERASRNFLRFPANTIQRQAAVMNFLHNNKALQSAITNNFQTVAGQWSRILGFIKMFGQSIVGNPKDPSSLYAQVRNLITSIANWLNKHYATIKKVGTAIGMVLGWIVHTVGGFIKFLGRQVDQVLTYLDNHMGNFKHRMWSLLLWLELWKVHILSFLKEHKKELITLLKAYLAFRAITKVISYWKLFAAALTPVITRLKVIKRLMIMNGTLTDPVGFRTHKLNSSEFKKDANAARMQASYYASKIADPLVPSSNKEYYRKKFYESRMDVVEGETKAKKEFLLARSRKGVIGRGFRTRGSLVREAEGAASGMTKFGNAAKIAEKTTGGLMGKVSGIASGIFSSLSGILRMIPGWGWILAGAILLATQWDKIKKYIMPVVDQIVTIGKQLWNVIVPVVEKIAVFVAQIIQKLGPVLVPILKVVGWLLTKALQALSWILDVVMKIANKVVNGIVWYFQHWVDLIKSVGKWLRDARDWISNVADKVADVSKAFYNWAVPQGLKDAINWISNKVEGIQKFLNMDHPFTTDEIKSAIAAKKARDNAPVLGANPQPWFGNKGMVPNLASVNPFYVKPDINGDQSKSAVKSTGSVVAKQHSENPMLSGRDKKEKNNFEPVETGGVSIESGAVQIVVQKGENIDEQKLAGMIKQILPDLIRKSKLQAGQ